MAEDRDKDRETLEYVSAMLAELRRLSGGDSHPMLSYLIEMAYLEAQGLLKGDMDSGRGNKRDAVA